MKFSQQLLLTNTKKIKMSFLKKMMVSAKNLQNLDYLNFDAIIFFEYIF